MRFTQSLVLLGCCVALVGCEPPPDPGATWPTDARVTATRGQPRGGAVATTDGQPACARTPFATCPDGSASAGRGEVAESSGRVSSALAANTVLVYSDDFVHVHPGTFAEQALRRLGLVEGTDYRVAANGDWPALITAIQGGGYSVILFDAESVEVPTAVLDALNAFVNAGGRLIADYWGVGETAPPWGTPVSGHDHALWTTLGVAGRTGRDLTPPAPLYWWTPASPAFTTPESVMPLSTRPDVGFWTYGGPVAVAAGFSAPAGYSASATAGQAALVLGNGGRTVYRAFFDAPDGADRDLDGVPDAVELWVDLYLIVQGPCTPACTGVTCGSDGCGGSCGTCAAPDVCSAGACCTPACAGRECGDDGCGGTCGTCPANQPTCDVTAHCTCTPDCTGKVCGDDGCGGSCGACASGTSCYQGCCTAGCAGLECGSDECGQPCGTCTGGKGCLSGTCVTPPLECDTSHGPGCPGCGCEACVCGDLVDPLCCDPAGTWDALCAQECTDVCGGAACPVVPTCGLGQQCGDDGAGGTCGICKPGTNPCVIDHPCDGYFCNTPVPDGQSCPADADPCTADQCQAGTCVHPKWGVGHPCTSDGNPCTADVCDASGACSHPPLENGLVCNDASVCTTADHCQAGACVGTPTIVCTPMDQCHVAGVCDPVTGVCSNPAKADGTTCDDGNPCTQTDTCQAGVCKGGGGKVCVASDPCHVAGTCDPATGTCSNPAAANGTACTDGDGCTLTDTCQAGVCTGGNPKVCAASDACHVAGTCNPATGTCSNPAAANGTACSDGNACTQTDACQAGVCTGTVPVVCSAMDACHNAGTCDPATGTCSNPAKADGIACSDGNACTQTDTCQAGVCTGGNPKACAASDACHVAGTCDPASGACSNPVATDGTTCSDGDACTLADSCQAGVCTGSNPKVCAASDACHVAGTCNPASGACSNPAATDGTACSDGNACTLTDTCQAGACIGASPRGCTASDECHNAGTCDPASGACSNPAKADGTACSDGNPCTLTDTCQGGACTGASPKVCLASDVCHVAGTCDPGTGVCTNPAKADGAACSDGDACTLQDACQTGVCTGGSPKVCAASDACHVAGTCAPATGACSNPAAENGLACNDGNPATGNDQCQGGQCIGQGCECGTIGPCCDGCFAIHPGGACDDGDACTTIDACQAGQCVGSAPVVCAAQDGCHEAGVCDPATGACSNPVSENDKPCDDGDLCSQQDLCTDGVCTGYDPVVCGAPLSCHEPGVCDPATGTCSTRALPDGTACSDGSACTAQDACLSGGCAGTPAVTCAAIDSCHEAGVCDPVSGACSNPQKEVGAACSDGDACTQSDQCDAAGTCIGSAPVTCTAQDDCHEAGVCDPATGACSNPISVNDKPCDDGDACTQQDRCANGTCQGLDPVACGVPPSCHAPGVCDPATGMCSMDPLADGTTCNDGDACTASDQCLGGACIGTPAVTCSASDGCHEAGTCDPLSGACTNPQKEVGAACSDNDACTAADQCGADGVCAGTAYSCPALNACEDSQACDGQGGCTVVDKPAGTGCDDQDPCTYEDHCDGLGTCSGTATLCVPAACDVSAACDGAGGCTFVHREVGAPCDDGDPCTVDDGCDGQGTCVSGAPVGCNPDSSETGTTGDEGRTDEPMPEAQEADVPVADNPEADSQEADVPLPDLAEAVTDDTGAPLDVTTPPADTSEAGTDPGSPLADATETGTDPGTTSVDLAGGADATTDPGTHAGGGGGCSAATAGTTPVGTGATALLAALALAFAAWFRRRMPRGSGRI